MGDRFYAAQLKELGTCPGYNGKRKSKRMAWDDTKKAKAIKMYTDSNPTPANSMEVVAEIAKELDESPNGVRMILTKADVYVKKEAAKKADTKAAGGAKTGGTRINKEAAFASLREAIGDCGSEPDDEIITKLTGKAAQYFAEVLTKAASN